MNVRRDLALLLLASALFACGGSAPPAESPTAAQSSADADAATLARWGKFRSKRFAMELRLPGGSEWRIDDRSEPVLVATHAATRARIVAARWTEPSVQNHAACEAKAAARGLTPPEAASVVDESSSLRPDGEDVRAWVAIEAGASEGSPIRGHATAVGARGRKCWCVHYTTEVDSAKDEPTLSARLAAIREGTLSRVVIEGLEDVPRERRGP